MSLTSPYSVSETIDRLESLLRAHDVTIFARIDHRAAAADVGLAIGRAQVLIFGNPRIGTPVMEAAPSAAIDLPFKALACQDASGAVWLCHNSADYLARRHQIDSAVVAPLSAVAGLIAKAVQAS